MKTTYLKELRNDWIKNKNNNEEKLLKQIWPTCWLISILNNFLLNNKAVFTQENLEIYLKYVADLWINIESKWWNITIWSILFTEYWNDVLKNRPIRAYYINDITTRSGLRKFAKMLSNWNIFVYSRSSGFDFNLDKKDLVLDQEDYRETDSRHAVNIWIWKDWLLKEYGSYWDSKYNILWITPKSFAGLLKNKDIRKSVFIIKYL